MIPAQAVEAAAKAAYEVMPVELFGEDGPVLWEHLSDSILGNSRKHHELDRARAALEAAAPHMLAAALEDAAGQLDRELSETRQAQEKPWEWLAGIADAEQALRAYAARYTLNTDGEE